MENREIVRLQAYLQSVFRLPDISVRRRTYKDDSAEVYIGDEFVAVLYRVEEEGELSYAFDMAILDGDLPPPPDEQD